MDYRTDYGAKMAEIESIQQVGIGVHVEIDLIDQQGEAERMAFDIVRDEAADFDQGRLGCGTPLGKTLLGKFVGSTVPYKQGDIRSLKIISIRKSATPADSSAAERRQALLEQAVEKARQTDAEIFASSFTSKWGGYDTADTKWDEGT